MLNNAINTGTWPPSRLEAKSPHKRSTHLYQQKVNSQLDKKPRYQQSHTKIIVNLTSAKPSRATPHYRTEKPEDRCEQADEVYISKWKVCCEQQPRGKVVYSIAATTHGSIVDSAEAKVADTQAKITDSFAGSSLDWSSSPTPTDVFESFDTVSEISALSQFSDGEKIEKCFSDLAPCAAFEEVHAYDLVFPDSASKNFLDPGFLHGSFTNVSLCEPSFRFRSYGVRDLKSETSLNSLKEHILTAQRNKQPGEGDHCSKTILTARPEHSSGLLHDRIIPLNSGYIVYKDTINNRASVNRDKIFSSSSDIDNDTATMNYFHSLQYLKQKDVESCRASGPGLQDGTAGDKVTFYVFTDKDNYKLLKVLLTGPRLVPPTSEVTSLAEGFYAVTYWPDRVGWYVINVLWRGRHISGSPFQVLMLLPKRNIWVKRS